MVLTSYAETIRVRYVSTGWSKATIFNTVVFILAIVFPYFLCYRAQGFWVRFEQLREQPQILWKHEILLLLDTKSDSGDTETLMWTTFPGLKSMIETKLTPFITSREGDTNYDDIRDFLEFEITVPLPSKVEVHGVDLLLLFEYRLQKYAMLEMESMIFLSKKYGTPGNRLEFVGDISLVQKEPLWNRYVDLRYNQSVVPSKSFRLDDYKLSNIVNRYAYRNVSTILKNNYELWLTDANSAGSEFSIQGKINYVEETYECWAGMGQILKWAWVQYFSVFVIVYIILKKFQGIVHKARIFDTYLDVPWGNRLSTQPKL